LEAEREAICASYARKREVLRAYEDIAFTEPDDSPRGKASPRMDPYRLDELCSDR
jgi:hypothetical protein